MADETGPVAAEVVYEDEFVRVWRQEVPAGGVIGRHEHKHDYFLLNVAGEGPIDVRFHEGSGGEFGESFSFHPQPGRADYVPKGHIETATNTGAEYRAVLVELKKT